MDWAKGYSSMYYATVVDRNTWADTTRFEITGGTIQKTDDDLLESADIDTVNYSETNEQWIRVWLDTRQEGGSYSHTPLFTGLATSPSKSINGVVETNSVQCYSVLKPAQDVLLPRGWYAPIDIGIGTLIKRLLSVCFAPVDIYPEESFLEYAIIAEDGETNLSMAWALATAAGWLIKIGGDGVISIGPKDDTTKLFIGANSNDIVETSISVEYDWYACPNVLRATSNGVSATVRDDDPDSILSTVSRGREIWAEENDCELASGQSVSEYARAKLSELQTVMMKVSYDRRFYPGVSIGDVIHFDYPVQNLMGRYLISSQSITLGHNAKVSEEVVKIWD